VINDTKDMGIELN